MNRSTLGLMILMTSALVVACSTKTTDPGPATSAQQSTSAAVAGAADTHCAGKPIVVVSQAACHPAETDAGHGHDAGEADAGHGHEGDAGGEGADEYGATLFNSEGDDDQCKYHVKWTSSAVAKDTDVTLSVVATNRKDSSPVAAAKPYAELFLNETHPGPNTPVVTTETSPGNYTIGPVRFDASGTWNVRFHFAADCADGDESPHGHVAFFLNVP